MAHWSVAQTHPFAEQKAVRFLKQRHVESYLPRIRQVQLHHHHRRVRVCALFARYLFVRIEAAWHHVNSTPGISSLLINGNQQPVMISDRIISELRAKEDGDGLVILPKVEPFKRGQHVRVISGQFAGSLALYDGMTSRQRERVLLDFLGQMVPVELNIDSKIEAVLMH